MNFAFILVALPSISAFFMPQWKTLRENVEIVSDVAPGHEKRFLYSHNSEGPLFLFVTPCGAPVHWRIYSVQGGENELSPTESLDSSRFELIAGQEDDRRMTFFKQNVSRGPLMLALTSSKPSSARLFLSHSQEEMDAFYPPLPHDTRLAYAISKGDSSETNQVLITWKAADRVRSAEANRYRFCAIVSRRVPDWAVCGELNEGLESIHCVPQTNNSMIIQKLRLGKYYFITLFVRDSLHGSTSSYETLEVNLRRPVESSSQETKKDEVQSLHNAVLESGNLPPKKSSTLDYQFVVPTNETKSNKVLLIVHACEGYVRMSVYRNGKLLKRSEPFSGFRRFLVVNVHSGQLRFQISNDDAKPKTVHLWASTQTDQSPYPKLPEDTSVKVVRRSCSTATLQWLRSADEHAEYCIYMRRENANYLEELVSKASNLCEGGLESSELVGCYSHRGPSLETILAQDDSIGLIETTVVGLEPAKTYRFDLLATPLQRPQAQSLPYRTVWARTSNSC
uniref:NDNF_C domain-containing protein n=1 Tax=Haemonchus contortus TaxID=6289 RepID=A0A7I4YNR8_HAECO